MIAQSPRERELYEARLKFERDQNWRIKAAREEGVAEGIERGELSGRIRVLQSLLGMPESPLNELAALDTQVLRSLCQQLQTQVGDRHS